MAASPLSTLRTPSTTTELVDFATNYHCSSVFLRTSGVITLCFKQLNFKAHLATRAMASSDKTGDPERDNLVADFMRYVNATKQSWPLEGRRPTALMPPNTVVKVQMDALMRNDWPEDDSGVKTAFKFSMPAKVEEMLAGQVPESVSSVRAWDATERYLTMKEFSEALRDPMYSPIVNCLNWEIASPVVFHGSGDKQALQCVKVIFQTSKGSEACRAYTFCLQKVQQGAYRNCWMVVGVRLGDYANV